MMRRVFKDPRWQDRFERDGYIVMDLLDKKRTESLLNEFYRREDILARQAFATSTMSSHGETKVAISKKLEGCFSPEVEAVFEGYKWLFGSFIYKYPSSDGQKGEVTMHQDATLVDESKFHGINIFCALTGSDAVSGTLEVVPGSHRLNPHPRGFGQPFPYGELDSFLKAKMKRIDLLPGQAVIYTTKLFHYSRPNRSDGPRVIAAGIVAPEESRLRYYHVDRHKGSALEIFEVDADHYLTEPFFSRPDEKKYVMIGEVKTEWTPLSEDEIEQKLTAAP